MTTSNTSTKIPNYQVYAIQQGMHGPIKIGVSGNVDKRIYDLQTASPQKIALLGTFSFGGKASCYAFESELHDILSKHRMNGEWFGSKAFKYLLEHPEFVAVGYERKTALPKMNCIDIVNFVRPYWCGKLTYEHISALALKVYGHNPRTTQVKNSTNPKLWRKLLSAHDSETSNDSSNSLKLFCGNKCTTAMPCSTFVDDSGYFNAKWTSGDECYLDATFVSAEFAKCSFHLLDSSTDSARVPMHLLPLLIRAMRHR